MAIRSGLAVVAGRYKCNRYSGRPQDEPYISFLPTVPEIFKELSDFIESEGKRLANLRAYQRR